MPDIRVEIKNLPQIKAAFRLAPAAMTSNLNKAIQKSIFDIERQSKINSPVRTGRLRASHTTSFSNLRGETGPTVNYAIFVHQGTRYMHARPFLFNAVNSRSSNIQDYFQEAVQDTLDQIARSIT